MSHECHELPSLLGLCIKAGAQVLHLIDKASVQGLSRTETLLQKLDFTLQGIGVARGFIGSKLMGFFNLAGNPRPNAEQLDRLDAVGTSLGADR